MKLKRKPVDTFSSDIQNHMVHLIGFKNLLSIILVVFSNEYRLVIDFDSLLIIA